MTEDDFVGAIVACYRANFDPSGLDTEIGRLEAEHDVLTQQCPKLMTQRAIEKVNGRLAELETRITELDEQRKDVAEAVERQYHEVQDLQDAISTARLAMRSESGERAMRLRAEALRAVIHRIECAFEVTGRKGGPGGNKARLVSVTIYPVKGDQVGYRADGGKVLRPGRASSRS